MKLIRVRINEALAAEVDDRAKRLETTRSAFIQNALRLEVRHRMVVHQEAAFRASFELRPRVLEATTGLG